MYLTVFLLPFVLIRSFVLFRYHHFHREENPGSQNSHHGKILIILNILHFQIWSWCIYVATFVLTLNYCLKICRRTFLAKRQSQEDKRERVKLVWLLFFVTLITHQTIRLRIHNFAKCQEKNPDIQIYYESEYPSDILNPVMTLDYTLVEIFWVDFLFAF